jgi:predicted  nucleic acid-binding Zn-ribbon protein
MLSALIALQALDSAIDQAKRRLAEMPAALQALDEQIATASAAVDAAKAKFTENQTAWRALEKDVAAVDTRMARFEDHKAAVKTNQEYTALNHEIATAKSEKNEIEERILLAMEEGEKLGAGVKTAETALAEARRLSTSTKAALLAERAEIDTTMARLAAERTDGAQGVAARGLALYEQLLKGRRGIGVAAMVDGHCAACHVRLRPHVTQQVRRNEDLIQCDSCQRILYYVPPPPAPDAPAAGAPAPGTGTASTTST